MGQDKISKRKIRKFKKQLQEKEEKGKLETATSGKL